MTPRAIIAALCLIGLYAATFMLRKQVRAALGALKEPSVVQSPRARVAGVPNALFGLLYYAALLAVTPFLQRALVWEAALGASAIAATFSLYLAYSLLFVTRLPCAYCWTGHAVNWSLFLLLLLARPGHA